MDALTDSFRHTCEVYRMYGETEFVAGTKVTLYSGACMVYAMGSPLKSGGVVSRQVRIDIPSDVPGAKEGVAVDFTDDVRIASSQLVTCVDELHYGSRVGTTLYVDYSEN